jgi:phenylacetic acid degradation operon negative regulatory protein
MTILFTDEPYTTLDLEHPTWTTQSTQFCIFNLFADYILPYNNGWARTDRMLHLLGLLGVSDRAARTTLARMRQRGWFRTERSGRQSRYFLTDAGKAIIDEGHKRIFEEPLIRWDGTWHTLVYSLPEQKRDLRNELRKKLIWFGFGRLAPGTWISPHDRWAELESIIESLDVRPYISLFASRNLGIVSNEALVTRCWDLKEVEQAYVTFVDHWRPELSAHAHRTGGNPRSLDSAALEQQFLKRFQLTFDFQPFPRIDPNLPLELLPPVWQGHAARRLFRELRSILNEGLPAFMTGILG